MYFIGECSPGKYFFTSTAVDVPWAAGTLNQPESLLAACFRSALMVFMVNAFVCVCFSFAGLSEVKECCLCALMCVCCFCCRRVWGLQSSPGKECAHRSTTSSGLTGSEWFYWQRSFLFLFFSWMCASDMTYGLYFLCNSKHICHIVWQSLRLLNVI